MGNLTFKGFVPRDDPMFLTGPELFSRADYLPSSTSTAKSTIAEASAKSDSAASTDHPMQPAANPYEKAMMELVTAALAKDPKAYLGFITRVSGAKLSIAAFRDRPALQDRKYLNHNATVPAQKQRIIPLGMPN